MARVVCLGVVASGKLTNQKLKLDINQKVYIENQQILGDGSSDGALNQLLQEALASPATSLVGASRAASATSPVGAARAASTG